MDDFVNQLTSIATTWSQAGAIAGLILVVNLLTNLTKLQRFQSWVPAEYRSYFAAGLGMLGGSLTALSTGKPIPQALLSGLIIGMGAIGTHELMTNAKMKMRLRRVAARAVTSGGKVAIVFLLAIPLSMVVVQPSCGGTGPSPVTPIVDDGIDCIKTEAAAAAKGIDVITAITTIVAKVASVIADPASLASVVVGFFETYGEPFVACVIVKYHDAHTTGAGSATGSGGVIASVVEPDPTASALSPIISSHGWKFKSVH